jgi:hypothetical protein
MVVDSLDSRVRKSPDYSSRTCQNFLPCISPGITPPNMHGIVFGALRANALSRKFAP